MSDRARVRAWIGSALSTLPRKLVAAASGVAAIAGALFLFVPGLQPHVQHCRESAEGDLSQIRVEQGTYRDFLLLSDRSLDKRPSQQLKLRGDILLYKAVIEGFKSRPITLRWSLLSAKDHRLIENDAWNNVEQLTFTSDRCSSDQFGQPAWIPAGADSGKPVYAEVLLYDPKRQLLVDSGRSPTFVSPPA